MFHLLSSMYLFVIDHNLITVLVLTSGFIHHSVKQLKQHSLYYGKTALN